MVYAKRNGILLFWRWIFLRFVYASNFMNGYDILGVGIHSEHFFIEK